MSLELKIKSKHLAAEAKIIRREEAKLKRQIRSNAAYYAEDSGNDYTPEQMEKWKRLARERKNSLVSMNTHRRTKVRTVARSTHLAYGFLRGTPYRVMENEKTRTVPNWNAIEKMITKYSTEDPRVTLQRFASWKSA